MNGCIGVGWVSGAEGGKCQGGRIRERCCGMDRFGSIGGEGQVG